MPGGDIETVETHEKSSTHAEKEEQFQKYKEIYLAEIHPCLVKEKELRKMAENISSSADIGLDLDRLETPLFKAQKGVQDIETSLDWANTTLLMRAVKELEVQLQGIFKLLEQGMFRMQTFLFSMIQADIKLFSLLGLHTIHHLEPRARLTCTSVF